MSDQIIAIIDELCRRFGIVIDWTAENVMPYLEDLCSRYVQFEIHTSISWIVCCTAVTLLAGIIWAISAIVDAHSSSCTALEIKTASMVVFWIGLLVTIIVGMVQAYDIIECHYMPEKVVIEYIESLINNR